MVKKASKRVRDSFFASIGIVGFISTVMSIIGNSLSDVIPITGFLGIILKFLVVILIIASFFGLVYAGIGIVYKNGVKLTIRGTSIEICSGDIFKANGLRVIGCDTHFDTRADGIIISKTSLQGKLILEHGNVNDIKKAVKAAAQRCHYTKDQRGQYTFPLGSIVKYDSDEKQTYLMLAMTALNADYEAHTNMAEYEQMLMKMWKEIDRVYNGEPVAIPLLGTGMTRFDDGNKDRATLLRCMLCTLNASAVTLKAPVKIIIQIEDSDSKKNGAKKEKIPMYEFKDALRIVSGKA